MPSGNSVAALVLSRLSRITGERRWREGADLQLRWLAGTARDYPAGYSFAMLAFLETLWPTAELVVVAQEPPEDLTSFFRVPRPELTVLLKTPECADGLAVIAPYAEEYPIPERGARYYLCQGGSCSRPVDSVGELETLLPEITQLR